MATGLATKVLNAGFAGSALRIGQNDYDYSAVECCYLEPVFASIGGDAYKNDQTSFLFQKRIAADTIALELWLNGVKVADIVDNTYGTYYATFTAQPLYVGLLLDWELVIAAFGAGQYQLNAETIILGVSSTINSRCFRLLPYSDEAADGTVTVSTLQTGNILSSAFDYTDLVEGGWIQQIRIDGWFGFKTPTLELDNYLDSSYNIRQIQDKITEEYTLESKLLPGVIFNLLQEQTLANQITITDYNIFNSEIFRDVEVVPVSYEEVKHNAGNRRVKYVIKFQRRADNIRKRNF